MTYNHASYIKDAMDGFVMQETHFPYVATIVDDASMDNAPQIISDYFNRFFDIGDPSVAFREEADYGTIMFAQHKINRNCYFAVLLLKENHYSKRKSKQPYLNRWCNNTEYFAICEGDDFWTDSLKLQKQVSILEGNNQLMAVVTNSKVVDKDGRLIKDKTDDIVPNNIEGWYSLHDFFRDVHHYPTATVLYRNEHSSEVQRMVSHTSNIHLGDWTLWAILHSFGGFYYLDEVTSAYRINPTSLTHTVSAVGRAKANKTICKALSEVLPKEYSSYLKEDGWMCFSVFMAYRKEKKYLPMLLYLMWCIIRYPVYTIKKLNSIIIK